jgi:hypothetical protein
MLAHRIKAALGAITTVGLLGLFAVPGEVRAAAVVVTVSDASGTVPGAFVALVNGTTKEAIDAAITNASGVANLDSGSTALTATKLVVSKPGYTTNGVSSVSATTAVTLTAVTTSGLRFANAYGAQVRNVAADGDSGVFYATTDNNPSVWRTTDYAGTWAPVPTVADSTTGLPQVQANVVTTSGYAGEVAVGLQNGLYYSKDYGNTWTALATTGSFGTILWGHSGTSSYLLAKNGATWQAAVMNVDTPALSNWTAPSGMDANGKWAIASGVSTSNKIFVGALPSDGSDLKLAALAEGATTVAGITGTSGAVTGLSATATNSGDLLMMSTQGQDFVSAFVVYDREGTGNNTTGTLKVGYKSSSGATPLISTGLSGTTDQNSLNSWTASWSNIGQSGQSQCGENETTAVGSIANLAPASGALESFKVVGTIRGCFFAFNTSGASANYANQSGAAVATDKIAVLPMAGANNNTGFVFDAGFNFSDNMVGISGDGQFGLRKSAQMAAPSYRPSFGPAGARSVNEFIAAQAGAGKEPNSGGIAVNGMVGAVVRDTVYSPNVTDGSTYVVSTSATGGSRTLLTTDSGASFSTLGAGGSDSVDWWNGASGKQWIAAGYALNSKQFFRIKNFSASTGTGKTQMGEELAATAAARESKTDTSLRFAFDDTAPIPSGATCFGLQDFIYESGVNCSSGQSTNDVSMTAVVGVAGTDAMLVAISKGQENSGTGTLGVVGLTADTTSSGATIAGVRYFGSEVSESGVTTGATSQFGVSKSSTYAGIINAIAYCPTGSATQVADKAFIAVAGKGIYVLNGVSTVLNGVSTSSRPHAATSTTTGTYKDLKADCDTGILVGVTSDGPSLSLDGDKFIAVKTPAAIPANNATAVDIQADKTTGEVTIVEGTQNSSVIAISTTLTKLGTTGAAVAAGTAKTPTTQVTLDATEAISINESSKGRDTGAVADVELPPASGDKVGVASVRALGLRKFASSLPMSIGTGGGAFKATTKGGSTSAGGTTPGAGTPGVGGTPGATAPGAVAPKVVSVKKGKTVSVTSALKTLGTKVVAKSKIVTTVSSASKKVCSVSKTNVVKGVKAGKCSLTVKITPPATKKVKKPKTTTKKITITIK